MKLVFALATSQRGVRTIQISGDYLEELDFRYVPN